MKLELDVWYHLLDVYTTLQSDISKHIEKCPENFEKSKTRKNNRQNSENQNFEKKKKKKRTYVKKYTVGHLYTKSEEFILIYGAMIAKNEFDLLLAAN